MQILAARQSGIEALVGASVVTQLAAHGARRRDRVMACDQGRTGRRQEQRRENTKERRFACAVCTEKGHRFTAAYLKRNILQSGKSRRFERLQESAPTRAGGREKFGERV